MKKKKDKLEIVGQEGNLIYAKQGKAKIVFLQGYGDNCDCAEYGADCPVLYGGECDWRFKS